MPSQQRKAMNLNVLHDVWRAAKIAAIEEGITLTRLVELAITEWIANRRKTETTND